MKKIYIAMLALGATLLSSCVQEKNFKDITVGENEIAFVMQGVSTRSAVEGTSYAVKGITIPMGEIEGESLYLEETIEELNPVPATKGAPAYTTTLPDVYPTMGVYAAGNFGDATFEMMDEDMYLRKGSDTDKGWRYHHNYNANPWPADGAVDFYLRMPEGEAPAAEGTTTEEGPFVYTASSHFFKLTSPLNGKEQDDILFGHVQMTKDQHDKQLPNGYPVTMKHALTGIKFRNGHLNDNKTKTIITHVALVGLNTYGEGTVGEDGVVTWSKVNTPNTEDNPFYLEFANPDYNLPTEENPDFDPKTNPDGTVGSNDWNDGLKNTSWTSAAADHNLNNAKGELTFWFIPQEVPDDLVLHVVFRVKTPDTPNGVDVVHTINLGALLNEKYQKAGNTGKLKWEAGQLRTYTLKPYDVDVEIMDKMTAVKKSDLHVANTGNVDEYVRMLIMGNWYGWKPGTTDAQMASTEPSILVGYKYKDAAAAAAAGGKVNDMVEPWFREGQDTDGDDKPDTDIYGTFDSSFLRAQLGDRDGKRNDWADASGGFYFTMPIGPGAGVGEGAQSATKDLFKSYTVSNVPTIYLPVGNTREPAVGVHLVMEIVVQAIAVPTNDDGTPSKWWLEAWYDATHIEKLNPNSTKNAKYKALYTNGEYEPNTNTNESGN